MISSSAACCFADGGAPAGLVDPVEVGGGDGSGWYVRTFLGPDGAQVSL